MAYFPYPQYNQFAQYNQPVPDQLQQLRYGQLQQPVQMQTQNQDERIWVQGEGAAQAYLVAPNSFVRLWDSQRPVFYEKRADQSGKPYMDVFEYSRKGSQPPMVTDDNYNNLSIKALEKRIEALEKELRNNVPKSNADDATVSTVQE